jgi:hypothetical protein
MYVLAQFSERTSFDWLTRLRAQLGKDELKHADYLHAGLLYAAESDLWRVVDAGVQQASIFIVDPHTYVMQLIPELVNSGAEYGVDFTWRDILHLAAEKMIAETPAYELTNSSVSMELVRLTSARNPLCGLLAPKYLPLPSDVLKRIGGRIRDALRFAARSYAVFEFAYVDEEFEAEDFSFVSTRRFDLSNRIETVVRSTLSTRRIFDVEDSKSVQVIAETANTLAMYSPQPSFQTLYIREEDSRKADGLQAADIAAGIARTVIDSQGLRGLVNRFPKVRVNGVDLQHILR